MNENSSEALLPQQEALILVDLQNDFLPGGALEVPHGDEVIPVANRLLKRFELTIATQDWHPPDHVSFAANQPGHEAGEVIELDGHPQILWPVHCVRGTRGAEFPDGLEISRVQHVFRKGTDPGVDSYSCFFDNRRLRSTGVDEFLKKHLVKRLVLMGLATDYCVKFSVLDALKLNYHVRVVREGCRGVERKAGDVEEAWHEMEKKGAQPVHLEDL